MSTIPEQRVPLIDVFMDRNSKINLSAIRNREDIYTKHIVDALEIMKIKKKSQSQTPWCPPDKVERGACDERGFANDRQNVENKIIAIDLGTWGWFPLLPLAITYPHISRTWLDARRKKIDAINDMATQLWLTNCTALHGRAEEHTHTYDILTARAVAYTDKLFPWIDRLLRPWGTAILYKLYTPEEHKALKKITKKLKRTIRETHHYTLAGDEVKRCLYIIQKK